MPQSERGGGVDCPSCGSNVAATYRYCPQCATPLSEAGRLFCDACRSPNPANAQFCYHCGAMLGALAEADRRIITVLFADLSGFTSLTEQLDAEHVRQLIGGCLNPLCDSVTRWGGFVDKFIGDCVMALFGAPVAYENEEERAIRAGLGIAGMAIVQGRTAAETIHSRLRGLPLPVRADGPPIQADSVEPDYYEPKAPLAPDHLTARAGLADPNAEVGLGITEAQFLEEISRCYSCGLCFGCQHCWMYCSAQCFTHVGEASPGTYFTLALDQCEECGKCVELCPCGYLEQA